MQAMPVHSLAFSRSPVKAIDDSSAITGIANMLSDAVPAGRWRRTAIHSRKPSAVDITAGPEQRAPRSPRSIASADSRSTSGSRLSGRTPASICHAM